MKCTNDIRADLIEKYLTEDYVIDKSGVRTIEVLGESFVATEDWLIRTPAYKYIERELQWYDSQSLYVDDIPGETPQIWKEVGATALGICIKFRVGVPGRLRSSDRVQEINDKE